MASDLRTASQAPRHFGVDLDRGAQLPDLLFETDALLLEFPGVGDTAGKPARVRGLVSETDHRLHVC